MAITPDKQILLKREYRYSCKEDLVEIPAGTFDKGETDPLAVAKRELLEETGYSSENWTYLGATRGKHIKTNKHDAYLPCQRLRR